MLRDPVKRVLSFYNYLRGKTDHPLHAVATTKSFVDFLTSQPSPEVNNGQARRFSGHLHTDPAADEHMAEAAIDNLSRCFSLVLTTERFEHGLLLLQQDLRLVDVFSQRQNTSQPFIRLESLSAEEVELIRSLNRADQLVWAWADAQLEALIEKHLSAETISQHQQRSARWAELLSGH